MPRNSFRSIKTHFAPLVSPIRNSPSQSSFPSIMAIEFSSALRNPNPASTSDVPPTELTIEPLVVSSPFAHRLQENFPSDNYVLGLYAILANPRLAPTIEPPTLTLAPRSLPYSIYTDWPFIFTQPLN